LDHHQVHVLRIAQRRVLHCFVRGRGNLADHAHPADLFRRNGIRAGTAHHQPLLIALATVGNLDPLARDRGDVRRDYAGTSAREYEDHMLGDLVLRDVEKLCGPIPKGRVSPDAAPIVVRTCAFGFAHQRDECVRLDLSCIRELLQPGRVRGGGGRAHEHLHTLSLHPVTSISGGRWKPNPGICSSCSAKSSRSYSWLNCPTSCTPIGSPSCRPAGMEIAGERAKVTGSTNCTWRAHSSPRNGGTFSIGIGGRPRV